MRTVISIFVCSLMILSCEVDDSSVGSDLFYPMQEGNVWKYLRTNQFENIVGDSLPVTVSERIDTSYAAVWVNERKTLKDNIKTMVVSGMISIGEETDITGSSRTAIYYAQNEEGLYIHAYYLTDDMNGLLPKLSQKYQFRFNNNIYNSIDEIISDIHMDNPLSLSKTADDSLIYENPPVFVLKYPLSVGSQWTYRNSPWRIDKIVEEKNQITAAGQNFMCYKIRWYYDIDGDNEWDEDTIIIDYVSEQGLIQRDRLFSHVIVADMGGNELGSFDMHTKLVLQDYNLH